MIVLSTLALKGVIEKLRPPGTHHFDSTQSLLKRLAAGEHADVLILTTEAMDDLRSKGRVTEVRPVGSSGVGVAVRAGAPKPDISTPEALLRTLLRAESVAHSKSGASGIYFSAILQTARIAERLKKRVIVEKGPVGLVVARGEAELGVQMLCELAPVAGIDIVGPLPGRLQVQTHFAAGIPADSTDAEGARALVDLLRSDAARRVMREVGLEPAA
jgi:molybdate transport system substrate-binding protein